MNERLRGARNIADDFMVTWDAWMRERLNIHGVIGRTDLNSVGANPESNT